MPPIRTPPEKAQNQAQPGPSNATANQGTAVKLPTNTLSSVTRKFNEINPLMRYDDNVEVVEEEMVELNKRVDNFESAVHNERQRPDAPEESLQRLEDWYQDKRDQIVQGQQRILKWIKDRKTQAISPEDSVSQAGSRASKASSTTSSAIKIRLAEKEAELAAEEEKCRKLNEIEAERRKLQRDVEDNQTRLKLLEEQVKHDIEKKKLERVRQAIEEIESASEPFPIGSRIGRPSQDSIRQPEPRVQSQPTSVDEQVVLLAEIAQRSHLPKTEPEIFDGTDPTKFQPFLQSFNILIADRTKSEAERLYYLHMYTKGEPHDLVQSCLLMDPTIGYPEAITLLTKEYGNPFHVAGTYLQRIQRWPTLRNDDAAGLKKFSLFLKGCQNFMKNVSALNQLNGPSQIQEIVRKLPFKMREQWRSNAYHILERRPMVLFEDLVEFVDKQTKIVSLPIFGEIRDHPDLKEKKTTTGVKKSFSMATGTERVSTARHGPKDEDDNKTTSACVACKKRNHRLVKCFFFAKKTEEEKMKILRENDICFGCLEPGHQSRSCSNRLSCQKCGGRHPTCLHKDSAKVETGVGSVSQEVAGAEESKGQTNATSACCLESTACSETGAGDRRRIALALVPVKVRVKGCQNTVITYAGLDNFATDCFITNDLVDRLGASGPDTEILLTTMDSLRKPIQTRAINNLEIMDLDENNRICLPVAFSKIRLPITKEDLPNLEDIKHVEQFHDLPLEFIEAEVGLMLGANVPEAIKPLEVVNGPEGGPYASRHRLGWAVNGPLKSADDRGNVKANRVRVDFKDVEDQLTYMYEHEFVDSSTDEVGMSVEDRKWLRKVEESVTKDKEGHYQIALPFRDENVQFPNNKKQALARVEATKRKLNRNPQLKKDYVEFMDMMVTQGYAERVPEEQREGQRGRTWYIVHHSVRHKQKGSLRIVFNCSLEYNNTSLNAKLLSGPDLTNNLLGVLLRFRQGRIAVTGDIEKMFYQVRIPEEDRDFLRYLWFPDGDLGLNPAEFRLRSHVFGATSSPACSNFALKEAAKSKVGTVEPRAVEVVEKDFYVDDLLTSMDTVQEAKSLVAEVKLICQSGHFNLMKLNSNSKELLVEIAEEELSKEAKDLDLEKSPSSLNRALGVVWDQETDSLGFRITNQETKMTRRGLLSTVFSIFDPIGYGNPVIMPAKALFQELCRRKVDWDEPLPEDIATVWSKWLEEVKLLKDYRIPRWYSTSTASSCQLHVFCDGSEVGFAAVAYFRVVTASKVGCSLVMAKSRLAPLKKMSIPRLELSGARLAAMLVSIIKKETTVKISQTYMWTDSMTVLKYLKNETKRFQRFVANRIAYIRERTEVAQWHHLPGPLNSSADMASRGVSISDFMDNLDGWKLGPEFLLQDCDKWPLVTEVESVSDDDPEVKKNPVIAATTLVSPDPADRFLANTSDWHRLRRMTEGLLKLQRKFKGVLETSKKDQLSAEEAIIQYVQAKAFEEEITWIKNGKDLKGKSPLRKLTPFLDQKGLLRVGGRLERAPEVPLDQKHPLILPRGHVSSLLAREAHCQVGHLGREAIRARLHERFWILGEGQLVKGVLKSCLKCRKYQGKVGQQLMADLPEDRVHGDLPPFTNVGLDLFGPFQVVRGRSLEDRYGLIFTCLVSRAVHLELTHSKSTDSFIMALRRFAARRGQIRTLRSDRGTNFVGAERELRDVLEAMDHGRIEEDLERMKIRWIFNAPQAHHFGGVWEREIRTVRKVMSGLISDRPQRLSDEELSTLMCEVEAVMNSKPLTPVSDDPEDLEALTPNHLLLQRAGPTYPPGLFDPKDTYSRKRWKRVQFLADSFWNRWRKEYLKLIMERRKWTSHRRNLKPGDLVLMVKEHTPRCQWPLARVLNVFEDDDGLVRRVKVKTRDSQYERPVAQLVLVQEVREEKDNGVGGQEVDEDHEPEI